MSGGDGERPVGVVVSGGWGVGEQGRRKGGITPLMGTRCSEERVIITSYSSNPGYGEPASERASTA